LGKKVAQQDGENKRLFQILQMGQESIVKQLRATSDQSKRENSAALKASMEIMETQMKEQNNDIKQDLANLLAVLNDLRKCS